MILGPHIWTTKNQRFLTSHETFLLPQAQIMCLHRGTALIQWLPPSYDQKTASHRSARWNQEGCTGPPRFSRENPEGQRGSHGANGIPPILWCTKLKSPIAIPSWAAFQGVGFGRSIWTVVDLRKSECSDLSLRIWEVDGIVLSSWAFLTPWSTEKSEHKRVLNILGPPPTTIPHHPHQSYYTLHTYVNFKF